jgi:hypothetical protein
VKSPTGAELGNNLHLQELKTVVDLKKKDERYSSWNMT